MWKATKIKNRCIISGVGTVKSRSDTSHAKKHSSWMPLGCLQLPKVQQTVQRPYSTTVKSQLPTIENFLQAVPQLTGQSLTKNLVLQPMPWGGSTLPWSKVLVTDRLKNHGTWVEKARRLGWRYLLVDDGWSAQKYQVWPSTIPNIMENPGPHQYPPVSGYIVDGQLAANAWFGVLKN